MIAKSENKGQKKSIQMVLPFVIFCLVSIPAFSNKYAYKKESWYSSQECKTIAENILTWQDDYGSWPKNKDTTSKPYSGDRKDLHGTFDNGATTDEMRILARTFLATNDSRCKEAFLKALDLIFKAQYPTGGWPQSYPPGKAYPRHITFNDNSMVRLMRLLDEIANSPLYDFVDTQRRAAAKTAFDKGIDCILKCQIRVKGVLTVWCAQHDEIDYHPQSARSYELVSLSGAESSGILLLLMGLESPSSQVIDSIRAGVRWYEASKVEGLRIDKVDGVNTAIKDPASSPLWARFYEIETNRPLFSSRDGIPKYDYNQIDPERRNGYGWYGDWGLDVFKQYEKWKEKFKDRTDTVNKEALTLVIVGDSTVCDFPDPDPRHGWGEFIASYFKESVKVVNLARSGRSTKTFLKEGLWEKALQEKPNFILIQFGHNDDHGPDKPESTNADTDYSGNLKTFITDARKIGAEPVLVTPVHRRKFDNSVKLKDTLLVYANAMKKVAAENQVAVVDLHSASGELFLKLGDAGCGEIGNAPEDRTHFNAKGAQMLAEIVMAQLPIAVPKLKPYLKETSGGNSGK